MLINNRFKFHDHVLIVTKKANCLTILHKTFEYMDGGTFVNLYESFVCPILIWQYSLGTTSHS